MHIIETKHLAHGISVQVVLDDHGDSECPIGSYDDAVRFVEFTRHGVVDTNCNSQEKSPFREPSDVVAWAKENKFICYPVFKYEHGNVAYSLGAFSCLWDSGQCGYLLLSRKEWKRRGRKSDSYARAALSTYTSWCNGEVYGFQVLDCDGETLDSCWGYIGDSDYCLSEGIAAAQSEVESIIKQKAKEKLEADSAFAAAYEESRPDMYAV
jgi:hypothetical protein